MKLRKSDNLIIAILLVIGITFAFMAYRHFNKRVTNLSREKPIGTVVYKYNSVLRKYLGRFIWENIDSKTPVYLYDSILTKDKSDAIIYLNSGVTIELNPNSLIQIDLLDQKVGLTLKKGVIRTKANKSKGPVLLKTSSGLLADINSAEAKFSEDKNGSKISVTKGKVKLKDREEQIDPGKIFRLAPNGEWSLQKIDIKELKPVDGSIILTNTGSKKITLNWDKPTSTQNFKLHLSSTSDFKAKKVIKTNKNSHRVEFKEGTWYWQVFSTRNGKEIFSAIQSFTIQKDVQFKAVFPKNSTVLVNKQNEPILFRWTSSKKDSPVNFILATDPNFDNTIHKKTVSGSSYVMKGLKNGKYYWKIIPEYFKRNIIQDTKEKRKINNKYQFIIDAEVKKLFPPKGLTPSVKIKTAAGIDKRVKFQWNKVVNSSYYYVRLFVDQKEKPNKEKKVFTNFIYYTIPWDAKFIYWDVKAVLLKKETGLILNSNISEALPRVSYYIPQPPKVISATFKKEI